MARKKRRSVGRPPHASPVLGLDVGGVIADTAESEPGTTLLGSEWMRTSAVTLALEAIAELVQKRFGDNVHLVSKAGPRIESRTRAWLEQIEFFDVTGVHREHVEYVRRREEKAEVCQRLAVTHFVDDRLAVLQHLVDVPHRYLFLGGLGDRAAPVEIPGWAAVLRDWTDAGQLLEPESELRPVAPREAAR